MALGIIAAIALGSLALGMVLRRRWLVWLFVGLATFIAAADAALGRWILAAFWTVAVVLWLIVLRLPSGPLGRWRRCGAS